jgi:hypothetical protein
MEHPASKGQMAHTLSAFVHYAFQWSEGEVIFADIQGAFSLFNFKFLD